MNEERPVVFTITRADSNSNNVFRVRTTDPRGSEYNNLITKNIWFSWLCMITRELNKKGYAVLFEVEN